MLEQYFAAKERLYPQSVKGRIRSLKWLLNFIFLSIYFLTPFLRFDRGAGVADQAVLIDIVNRKLYFFFIEIWPQEVYYLAAILVVAAVGLFFVTSLFGRVWCGYACFQTVWTDIFIALERLFQGDRNQRILLDRKKTFEKFWRKGLTHLSWILVALLTGYFFIGYFNDAFVLLDQLFKFELSFNALMWILGIAGMTYLMAGFAREHVCTFMCPYARFQSAMFDDNSLIITYDEKRGEPRAKAPKDGNFEGRGDCIDCKQCVVVCPTGIDIRRGLQMECIACGLCIDACNNVMDRVGLPRGLIRYDTLASISDPGNPKKKFTLLRWRTFFYAAILTVFLGLILRGLIYKSEFEFNASHNRNPIYVMMSDGSIRNSYSLNIVNKTNLVKKFKLKLDQPKAAALKIQHQSGNVIKVGPGKIKSLDFYLTIAPDDLAKFVEDRAIVEIGVYDDQGQKITELESIFIKK